MNEKIAKTWSSFVSSFKPAKKRSEPISPSKNSVIPPGRVSVPDDESKIYTLKQSVKLINPSFRDSLIKLIRDLYKVNPDVGITIQDMFKLANTGHKVDFPNNTTEEAEKMRKHLSESSKKWSAYTAGIEGLINKFIVQCYVSGAISLEAVPNDDMTGINNIVLINPETIKFERDNKGNYIPYQMPKNSLSTVLDGAIKLNTNTYWYVSMFNDTDEPYGIPPFLSALDSLYSQAIMQKNFKNLMEQAGMLGFLQANIEKSSQKGGESQAAYEKRLESDLLMFKQRIADGLADGIVVGHIDDHEFTFNSTTKNMANVDKFWSMNQQSVANGLGISSNIIGVQTANTEGGAGIMLSKIISQLRNIQTLLVFVLTKIYSLELLLAGFNNKGLKVTFGTTTISDELKVQQGAEIKLRNLSVLYNQGIISQEQYAWEAGYDKPDVKEPRMSNEDIIDDSVSKTKREKGKDTSDRSSRDKSKPNPKRADQDTKPRTT